MVIKFKPLKLKGGYIVIMADVLRYSLLPSSEISRIVINHMKKSLNSCDVQLLVYSGEFKKLYIRACIMKSSAGNPTILKALQVLGKRETRHSDGSIFN